MRARAARVTSLDLSVKATFSVPSFMLSQKGPEVLMALHGVLGSQTGLSLEDMHHRIADRLSDTRVIANLFRGQGSIEVRPGKATTTFNNLRSRDDFAICYSCIQNAELAVTNSLELARISARSVHITVHIDIGKQTSFIQDYMNTYPPSLPLDSFASMGNVSYTPRLHFDIENKEERWASSMSLQLGSPNEMILYGYILYSILPDQAENYDYLGHSLIVLDKAIESLGIDLSNRFWIGLAN